MALLSPKMGIGYNTWGAMKAWSFQTLLASRPGSERQGCTAPTAQDWDAHRPHPGGSGCSRAIKSPDQPGVPKQLPLPQAVETTLVLMSSRQLEITRRWERLLQHLREQRKWMAGVQAVLSLLQEVETASDQLKELQVGHGPADPWGTQQVWHSWGPSILGLQ